MRILSGYEAEQAMKWLNETALIAKRSKCTRGRCGSIILLEHGNPQVLSWAFNLPPQGKDCNVRCDKKHELGPGFKSDRTCCVHAEQAAILNGMFQQEKFKYSRLYFAKVDDSGQLKLSGKPYCTICSKMALHVGIAEWCLLHPEGVTVYDAKEYNDLSYEFGK